MLYEQIIEEIKEIPSEKLVDVYKLIHDFRLKQSVCQPKTYKTADEVFGKLYKTGQKSVSIEVMNLAIQNRMRDKFR